MEPISVILTTALGYILKGAAQSKTAEKAKEELLTHFWQWLRPKFINAVPELDTKPDDPKTEIKTHNKLLELAQNEEFFKELAARINALQKAGIKEKNIVNGDIKRVKKIRIGDKEYYPNDVYDRKNIVNGNIEDAEEFTLGDGH